jgi:hypothetical protein
MKFAKLTAKGTKTMTEYLIMLGIIAGWIVLQMWILPRFGIQT